MGTTIKLRNQTNNYGELLEKIGNKDANFTLVSSSLPITHLIVSQVQQPMGTLDFLVYIYQLWIFQNSIRWEWAMGYKATIVLDERYDNA